MGVKEIFFFYQEIRESRILLFVHDNGIQLPSTGLEHKLNLFFRYDSISD